VHGPNVTINPEKESMHVYEYLRERGNLDEMPKVKPAKEIVKIFGDP
jgi:hypothetical protein